MTYTSNPPQRTLR